MSQKPLDEERKKEDFMKTGFPTTKYAAYLKALKVAEDAVKAESGDKGEAEIMVEKKKHVKFHHCPLCGHDHPISSNESMYSEQARIKHLKKPHSTEHKAMVKTCFTKEGKPHQLIITFLD